LTVFNTTDPKASNSQQNTMYYWSGSQAGIGGVIARTKYNTQSDSQYFYSDAEGHGSHVTSIAAGSALGWATGANIYNMHINFFDSYGFSNNAAGYQEAYGLLLSWHNAKLQSKTLSGRPTITSNSYGYPTGTIIDTINLAVKTLTDAKIHFVHAAGNDGALISLPTETDFNISRRGYSGFGTYYGREPSPCYPTNLWTTQNNNPVICVGALGAENFAYTNLSAASYKAEYSNFGKGISIYAPGSNIQGAWIDTIYSAYKNGAYGSYGVRKISGTSMACPQVAGVLACMLDDMPGITPLSAKQKIAAFSFNGTISGHNNMIPNSNTLYSLSGGRNLVISQYPPKKIVTTVAAAANLKYEGLNYTNSNVVLSLSNIVFDSTVAAMNSAVDMTFY
jgi:hypothetical protein